MSCHVVSCRVMSWDFWAGGLVKFVNFCVYILCLLFFFCVFGQSVRPSVLFVSLMVEGRVKSAYAIRLGCRLVCPYVAAVGHDSKNGSLRRQASSFGHSRP